MGIEKKFQVIKGKVVATESLAAVTTVVPCTMCKIKGNQVEQMKMQLKDAEKKIASLKEEIGRVQNARAEKREAYSVVDIERRAMRDSIQSFARAVVLFMRYSRIILWTLKTLRDHPPGGFCVACEQADGGHDAHCAIANLFDEPAQVVLAHKGTKISDRDLPIPEELRLESIEPLIDAPWGLYEDLSKTCHEGSRTCGKHPLKKKLYCVNHMPRGY